MTEIRIPTDFLADPRIDALEAIIGHNCVGYVVGIWAYVASQPSMAETGVLPPHMETVLEQRARWVHDSGKLIHALVESGFLAYGEGGCLVLTRWFEDQPHLKTAKMRRERAQKAAAARWAKKPRPKTAKPREAWSFPDEIMREWNRIAGGAGFAKLRSMTGARLRTLKGAVKELGDNMNDWRGAINAYAQDAVRWRGRLAYGFDTFIRPSQRAKWFESQPNTGLEDIFGGGYDLGD